MRQHVERCAINSRQSRTYDSKLSSCDAQRQFCTNTTESFGWQVVDVFADNGKSSETLVRPKVQRLIVGVEQGQFDCVIVSYRIDRLTRPLHDLAKLFEFLDRVSSRDRCNASPWKQNDYPDDTRDLTKGRSPMNLEIDYYQPQL